MDLDWVAPGGNRRSNRGIELGYMSTGDSDMPPRESAARVPIVRLSAAVGTRPRVGKAACGEQSGAQQSRRRMLAGRVGTVAVPPRNCPIEPGLPARMGAGPTWGLRCGGRGAPFAIPFAVPRGRTCMPSVCLAPAVRLPSKDWGAAGRRRERREPPPLLMRIGYSPRHRHGDSNRWGNVGQKELRVE